MNLGSKARRIALMSSCRSVPDIWLKPAQSIFDMLGGNTGNVAFVNAISSHLRGEVNHVAWGATGREIRSAGDVLIIAAANQLGIHTDLGVVAKNIDDAGIPVLALGLGAQSSGANQNIELTDGTLRWLASIAAHAEKKPNIGVRGAYTLQQMECLGFLESGVVIGCPSNLTNLSFDFVAAIDAKRTSDIKSVASAIGIPYDKRLGAIERQILDLVDVTGGLAIVQHNLAMIRLAKGEFENVAIATQNLFGEFYRPELSLPEFQEWCRRRLAVFGDANAWMSLLQRFDFVLGPRFHGVMLALQAGVPAGCVAHDSRTRELCDTMGVPVREWNSFKAPLQLDRLHTEFTFDSQNYRVCRAVLARRYTQLLRSVSVSFDPKLMEVGAEAIAHDDEQLVPILNGSSAVAAGQS